ncbi:gamma-glutamyltransferase family protein [Rubeoparvulum massiliense]|uniref:gamma-glutamyltransferase family protein n=1 Tax=Rubeoparvulum massiliense TaxID=1631346 RepID=UPI00065DF1B6|nr:gamma-glutamyltransferase family protein [Rubeoparvulum massiliense]
MIAFDPQSYPYPSRRMLSYAKNGMVATSQALAAQAGLEILRKGGNAVDAAIATAACLTVVEPTSNGIGGDNFAIVWFNGKIHGLNSSGPAPRQISIEALQERGYAEMPTHGVIPITVPGAPAGWVELWRRFGSLPLTDLLAPAIRYAEEGFPLSAVVGKYWNIASRKYQEKEPKALFQPWFDTFAPGGKAPQIGEIWRSPDHAATLRAIAETEGAAFYQGELAERIVAYVKEHGGYLSLGDLAEYQPEWVQPLSVSYRGYDVWELPPNGQGMVALMALNILKGLSIHEKESVTTYHQQIEAMKLAFADGLHYITEPGAMPVPAERLLSEEFAAQRRQMIGTTALQPTPGEPPKGGTVYLATADGDGNMVSFIQSNYMGFGSGVVIPGTGIAMQNRGHNFSLDPTAVNALKPGKRTYHTIIPGFLSKDGSALGPFGVMGGFMQPQGHVQVVMNLIDFHLNPQAALDAPRWQWLEGKKVAVEPHLFRDIAQALARMGHEIIPTLDGDSFGRGQIILRDPVTGILMGGTEPRCDSTIALW